MEFDPHTLARDGLLACPACEGGSKSPSTKCSRCDGHGYVFGKPWLQCWDCNGEKVAKSSCPFCNNSTETAFVKAFKLKGSRLDVDSIVRYVAHDERSNVVYGRRLIQWLRECFMELGDQQDRRRQCFPPDVVALLGACAKAIEEDEAAHWESSAEGRDQQGAHEIPLHRCPCGGTNDMCARCGGFGVY